MFSANREKRVMNMRINAARLLDEGVKNLTLAAPIVTYRDGEGGAAFGSQTTLCAFGEPTPAFIGVPKRHGCDFKGWVPAVAKKVTGDAVYTARWEKTPLRAASANGARALEDGEPLELRGPVSPAKNNSILFPGASRKIGAPQERRSR